MGVFGIVPPKVLQAPVSEAATFYSLARTTDPENRIPQEHPSLRAHPSLKLVLAAARMAAPARQSRHVLRIFAVGGAILLAFGGGALTDRVGALRGCSGHGVLLKFCS